MTDPIKFRGLIIDAFANKGILSTGVVGDTPFLTLNPPVSYPEQGVRLTMQAAYRYVIILGVCVFIVGCRHKTPQLASEYDLQDLPVMPTASHHDKTVKTADVDVAPSPMPALPSDPPLTLPALPPSSATDWQSLDSPLPLSDTAYEAVPERRWQHVIHFAYNQSLIGASERQKLEILADYLKEHNAFHTVLEGHCDERGSDEFNRALGERRALAVKAYLVKLGIAENRLMTRSFGEERPANNNKTPEAYAQNRRVECVILVPTP